jgi:hypothetical protein
MYLTSAFFQFVLLLVNVGTEFISFLVQVDRLVNLERVIPFGMMEEFHKIIGVLDFVQLEDFVGGQR